MAVTIYHNPNCSTSRAALDEAKHLGVDVEVVQYLKTPLDRDQLVDLMGRLEDPPADLVRKDGFFKEKGLEAPKTWDDYLKVAQALTNPPQMYGAIVPSAETGAATILLETCFMKNDAHWFGWDEAKKQYDVVLDKGENRTRAIETLEFLHELHKSSPEASTYNWGELMSTYVSEKAATSWYVGARLLFGKRTTDEA